MRNTSHVHLIPNPFANSFNHKSAHKTADVEEKRPFCNASLHKGESKHSFLFLTTCYCIHALTLSIFNVSVK